MQRRKKADFGLGCGRVVPQSVPQLSLNGSAAPIGPHGMHPGAILYFVRTSINEHRYYHINIRMIEEGLIKGQHRNYSWSLRAPYGTRKAFPPPFACCPQHYKRTNHTHCKPAHTVLQTSYLFANLTSFFFPYRRRKEQNQPLQLPTRVTDIAAPSVSSRCTVNVQQARMPSTRKNDSLLLAKRTYTLTSHCPFA